MLTLLRKPLPRDTGQVGLQYRARDCEALVTRVPQLPVGPDSLELGQQATTGLYYTRSSSVAYRASESGGLVVVASGDYRCRVES